MATSPTTAAPTQSALTPWAPSLAPANQVLSSPKDSSESMTIDNLPGFTSWAAHSGCRDRNECCVGSYAECSHTCTRTSATTGLCINNAGSYTCGTCSTGGEVRWHYLIIGSVRRSRSQNIFPSICESVRNFV